MGIRPKQQQHEEAVQGACIGIASRQAAADKPKPTPGNGTNQQPIHDTSAADADAKKKESLFPRWDLISLSVDSTLALELQLELIQHLLLCLLIVRLDRPC